MRDRLKSIEGEQQTFYGRFVRFGIKRGYRGPEETILLKDIHESISDRFLVGHLWLDLTKGLQKLNLKPGDRVQFDAVVIRYIKGYQGWLTKIFNSSKGKGHLDFTLSHPSKVLKLKTKDKIKVTPL